MEFSTIFKIIVIIILFSILGINIFAYLAKGTDVLSKLTQKGGENVLKGGGKAVDDAVKETKKIAKKGQKAVENAVETQEKKEKQQVEADSDIRSHVQKSRKGGFCLVGNWRGYRSCVHVNDGAQCGSGEIYSTLKVCRNPTLRP
jgi:hypothetical protein